MWGEYMQKQVDFFANIPQEMKQVKQWVCRNGKIPINPYTGKGAKSNDPNTWSDYETAVKAMQEKGYDGIGFQFVNGYFGIDLDHCIDENGIPSKEAMQIVAHMQSYTEISPSGTGYHIICKGKLPDKGRKKGFIEMYEEKRYFTMTGNVQGGLREIFDRTEEVKEIYYKYFGESDEQQSKVIPIMPNCESMDDDSIIDLLFQREEVKKLWHGDMSKYKDNHSEADLGLCSFIANYTKDLSQIDRIFRKSSLMRDKWDRKTGNSVYGIMTIMRALQNKGNSYQVQFTDEFYQANSNEDTNNKQCINISGHDMIIPKHWEIRSGNTLWYIQEKKNRRGEIEIIPIFISRNTPFVTKRFDNVENGNIFYEVEWKDDDKKTTTSNVVTGSTIAQKKDLLELSNKGLAVNDNNARDLISFMSSLILYNDIERHFAVERLGNIQGKIIHPLIDTNVQIITLDQGEKQLKNAFKINGTAESWKNEVFSRIKDFPKAVFFVLSSFASVCIKDLNVNPFIVDLSGTTSQGKTTLLKACASVWGTNDLISEWHATIVSIERKSAFLNSFPVLIDDTRKAEEKVLSNVVYNHSGGRSKGRGSVKGTQKEFTWSNILLSTGEASLNEYIKTKGGAAARIIPLVDEPIKKDYDNVIALHESMRENYGVIGMEFLKLWEEHKSEWIPQFNETRRFYAKKSIGNEVLTRISEYYAAVVFVGRFLNCYLKFDVNLPMLESLFEDIAKENKDVDKPMMFLENILSDLDRDREHILNNYLPRGEIKAIYTKTGDLYLMPAYVNEFLDVEAKQTRKEWMKRGITYTFERNGSKQDTTVYKARNFNGKTFKAIKVSKKILNECGYDFCNTDD